MIQLAEAGPKMGDTHGPTSRDSGLQTKKQSQIEIVNLVRTRFASGVDKRKLSKNSFRHVV